VFLNGECILDPPSDTAIADGADLLVVRDRPMASTCAA